MNTSIFIELGNGDKFVFDIGEGSVANYIAAGLALNELRTPVRLRRRPARHSPIAVGDVRRFVHERLPSARMIDATHADVPFTVLLGIATGEPREGAAAAADASSPFVNWVHRIEGPLDVDALLAAIADLPRSVYRIKGFVRSSRDAERRWVLQAVGCRGTAHAEHAEHAWGDRDPVTELVVIADRASVDRADICARLDGCLATTPAG